MAKTFYDRAEELGELNEKLGSLKAGELVMMYGRRRVGKTELVRQFLDGAKAKKLYFYVELAERRSLMDSLESEVARQLGDAKKFEKWGDFFEYLGEKSAQEKLVFVVDEFQRFLEVAPDFISGLQRHWDEKLQYCKMMMIIVGSSIGMMLRVAKSSAGPLYGRVTRRLKVSPFRYADFREMFPGLDEEERIRHYAVFGGTPYYLAHAKAVDGGIHQRISALVTAKGGKLYEEPAILMESENMRAHGRYNSILQAISMGKETTKEMEDFTRIPGTTLPAYLMRLEELLDLVKRSDPVLGKEKHGRYRIKDNFFNFWYRFVFPNQSEINMGNSKQVEGAIRESLNGYVGKAFESIVAELLVRYLHRKIKGMEIDFEDIGGWWDRKGNEIDIVAYGKGKGTILLCEVKWGNEKADVDLLEGIIKKSKLVNFKGAYNFMLVSKSGFTERCLKEAERMGCVCLDLEDIKKLFDALG